MSDPFHIGANPTNTADDLPDFDKWWRENWNMHYSEEFVQRAFNDGALAARAERDAEIERLEDSLRDRAVDECIQYERAEAAEARVKELEEACAMKDRIIRNLHPEASGMRARLETLDIRLEATRKGYGYLQDRLESIGYTGWAHDMDGEINTTY